MHSMVFTGHYWTNAPMISGTSGHSQQSFVRYYSYVTTDLWWGGRERGKRENKLDTHASIKHFLETKKTVVTIGSLEGLDTIFALEGPTACNN